MNTLAVFIAVAVTVVSAQRGGVDPKNAAILAEARYLSGDGSFGAAYVQEDGVEFKEETGQNGERKGQYSYVDPSGKTITVRYTAGKEGFKVEGDHLPKAHPGVPSVPAPYRAPPQQYNNPAPQYNSQPQYNAVNAPQPGADGEDGQYRPEVHEVPYQYREGQQYQAPYNPAPQQQQPRPAYNQANFDYRHQQTNNNNYQAPIEQTTPYPRRFFPPGKLDLNRTPDGFNYQFQSRQ